MKLPQTFIYRGANPTGATAGIAYIPILTPGTIRRVTINVASDVSVANAVFEVTKNGVVVPDLSAIILVGEDTVIIDNTNEAVAIGDDIKLNLVSGSVVAPVNFSILIDDNEPAVGDLATATYTTASLANLSEETGLIVLAKSFEIHKIAADYESRATFYSKAAYRAADSARAIGTAPSGEHGVIADFNPVAANLSLDTSPIPSGTNREAVRSNEIPIRVQNRSGAARAIIITVTYLIKEV